MTTQQPEALRLANVCSNLTRYSMDAHLIAAELRRQHARITELESQLAQRFDAADMATAAAQGFRDGVSSVSAGSEPVAWRLRNTAFRSEVYEYFKTKYLAECRQKQFNAAVDDGGLHDLTPLYAHPSPPEGMGAAKEQQAGWQPIETAPKDEIVLVAVEFDGPGDWRIKTGYFWSDLKAWKLFGGSWTPTHWMPMPPPPSSAQREVSNG